MTRRLYDHWVTAALLMAILLLLLAPLLALSWSLPRLLIYLLSPAYMLHQVEEHMGDRFRTFVNQHVFGGYEALTPESILVINLPGVWGVNLICLYAAALWGIGWGLAGTYLVLLNALGHLGGAAAAKGYNPGLWTALAIFLPLGGFSLWTIASQPGVTVTQHAVGLAVAIAIHAAIIVFAKIRASRLRAA